MPWYHLLAKIRQQEQIKHRDTHRFNVKNLSNMKEKNHGRWLAELPYIKGDIIKLHTNTLSLCEKFLL
jgi:hypothetical protein